MKNAMNSKTKPSKPKFKRSKRRITASGQISFEKVNGWGGKRRNAGRKNLSGLLGHGKRPRLKVTEPVHITLRLAKGVPSLRKDKMVPLLKKAATNAKSK